MSLSLGGGEAGRRRGWRRLPLADEGGVVGDEAAECTAGEAAETAAEAESAFDDEKNAASTAERCGIGAAVLLRRRGCGGAGNVADDGDECGSAAGEAQAGSPVVRGSFDVPLGSMAASDGGSSRDPNTVATRAGSGYTGARASCVPAGTSERVAAETIPDEKEGEAPAAATVRGSGEGGGGCISEVLGDTVEDKVGGGGGGGGSGSGVTRVVASVLPDILAEG